MPSHTKVACILADYLPIQVEQQRRGVDLPLLIPHPLDGSVIFACSPEATDAGVKPGLSLYQARQMLPQALVIQPDEMAYHAVHGALQAALQAFSPLIETVGLGEFLVDVRGLGSKATAPVAQRSGGAGGEGDQELVREIVAAMQAASGLVVRLGLAAGKFTAGQAARQAPADGGLVVPAGGEAQFLAPLSMDALPNLPGEMRRRLYLLDLYTLGDLAALRKPAVLRQFGGDIAGLYELARGSDPRPINPDVPPLRLVRSLRLASPLSERQALLSATQRLCWQLGKALQHKGYHAEGLKLTLYAADGSCQETGQAAKPPTSDEARLGRLAALLLGRLPVRAPVAVVALSVYPLRAWHLGLHQMTLADAGVPEKQLRFESALQLLMHRFGQTVVRVAALLGPPVPLPVQVTLDAHGQPCQLEFGGQVRPLLEVDECWREERQWWDDQRAVRRDYFRVTLGDGSMRNIFQDQSDGEWYLDRAWPLL